MSDDSDAPPLPLQVRVVMDSCEPRGQVMCPALGRCSVLNGLCSPLLVPLFSSSKDGNADDDDDDAGIMVQTMLPEPDRTPPVLRHLGTCERPGCREAVAPLSGMPVRVYRVLVGEPFEDPGTLYLDDTCHLYSCPDCGLVVHHITHPDVAPPATSQPLRSNVASYSQCSSRQIGLVIVSNDEYLRSLGGPVSLKASH